MPRGTVLRPSTAFTFAPISMASIVNSHLTASRSLKKRTHSIHTPSDTNRTCHKPAQRLDGKDKHTLRPSLPAVERSEDSELCKNDDHHPVDFDVRP
jgi:hypothetical protein